MTHHTPPFITLPPFAPRRVRCCMAGILVTAFGAQAAPEPRITADPVDALGITVTGGSREYSFTNKASAFFYGETGRPHRGTWQGFTVNTRRVLTDYVLLADSTVLRRADADSVVVFPDRLERWYGGGIHEKILPVDSVNAFLITLTSTRPVEFAVFPVLPRARTLYRAALSGETISIEDTSVRSAPGGQRHWTWVTLQGDGVLPSNTLPSPVPAAFPGGIVTRKTKRLTVVVAAGRTRAEAERTARWCRTASGHLTAHRHARIASLLHATRLVTSDPQFDRAFAWAVLSLDALTMNQGGRGIFAGLPWFTNYWGRDTFISLPGAALVTGRFSLAKEVFRFFAAQQERDSTRTDYGRIPNFIGPAGSAYNTADGTPRFCMMAREYVDRSGDSSFLFEMYPVILRAIEGTRRYHMDSLGFLTHGDAETWMDAAGPGGPWSPRGDRANDIQALWVAQLEAGTWMAVRLGDVSSAREWTALAKRVRRAFTQHFVAGGRVVDHLNADGSADAQERPNKIFTASLLDPELRGKTLEQVVSRLAYPYGVGSLGARDANFHPYHVYPPFYPKDAAYHNGIVWTWLSGPVVSELCAHGRPELAFRLSSDAATQILWHGGAGTQSELLDAAPRPGEDYPRLSGTFSQAWNLAEFVRNVYDDYLGVRVSLLDRTLRIRPNIPAALGAVSATLSLGGSTLGVRVESGSTPAVLELDGRDLSTGLRVTADLALSNGTRQPVSFLLHPENVTRVEYDSTHVSFFPATDYTLPYEAASAAGRTTQLRPDLEFATPSVPPGLRALKGPPYPTLANSEIKQDNDRAAVLIDAPDPAGDDTGPGESHGRYTYPVDPAFVPGCFDITRLQVRYDSTCVYFLITCRTLSDPGWHPEYGFQLTMLALAIDTDGVRGSGSAVVPHNAMYPLPGGKEYERLILVGGGVQVEDAGGNVLAAYIPVEPDVNAPLGDTPSATIRFALPVSLLGQPGKRWTVTLLAGGQDDHGGAGIGEFRDVASAGSDWVGGGKLRRDSPNVYDTLVVRAAGK